MKQPLGKKVKILRNVLIISLATLILYFICGCPILFPRLRMRLKEQEAMVGPSVILDTLNNEDYSEFQKLFVGETEYGIVFYAINSLTSDSLYYREKTGDLTLLAAPTSWENWHTRSQERGLPVYLFDEYPAAVRAEVDLTITGDRSDPYYTWDAFTRNYKLEASREDHGYFRFYIHVPQPTTGASLGIAGLAPQIFSDICLSTDSSVRNQTAQATVRLYGTDGALIVEETMTIRSIAASTTKSN